MTEMTEMVSSRVARGRGGPGCEQNGTSGSRFGRGDSYVELSGGGESELELCTDPEESFRARPEVALGTECLL